MISVSRVVNISVEPVEPKTVYERYAEIFPGLIEANRVSKNKALTLRTSIIHHAVAQDRCLDEDECEVIDALDHIIRNCP